MSWVECLFPYQYHSRSHFSQIQRISHKESNPNYQASFSALSFLDCLCHSQLQPHKLTDNHLPLESAYGLTKYQLQQRRRYDYEEGQAQSHCLKCVPLTFRPTAKQDTVTTACFSLMQLRHLGGKCTVQSQEQISLLLNLLEFHSLSLLLPQQFPPTSYQTSNNLCSILSTDQLSRLYTMCCIVQSIY